MTEHQRGFRPIAALGATVALWLIISAVGDGVGILLALADIVLIQIKYDLSNDVIRLWQAMPLAVWPMVALYIVLVVMVGMWIYRAAHNARLVRPAMETSPGWAVGWYFIPIANLWKPYQAMSQIWRISCRPDRWKSADTPAIMKWWWAGWLASSIISNVANRIGLSATTDEGFTVSAILSIVASAASLAATLALRHLVLQITSSQTNQRQAEVF